MQLAKEYGFESAIYCCDWENFSIYEPIFADSDDIPMIGEPQFILYDNGKIRFATFDEYQKFVKYLPE